MASRPGLRISEEVRGQLQFRELVGTDRNGENAHTVFFVDALSGIMIFNQIVSPFRVLQVESKRNQNCYNKE